MRYFEFRAMNTDILLAAEGPADEVEAGFQRTRAYIDDCERRFTRFSEDSELSSLNRAAGTWFKASPDLFEVVLTALRLHRQTYGLFDPSILAALEQAGYDRSMDAIRENGAGPVLLSVQVRHARFADTRLDPDEQSIKLPSDVRIDLGGVAKGWIAEQAALRLAQESAACAVDAGGDVFMVGLPEGQSYWRITLEDPCNVGRGLAVLKLRPGAVATSTITRRRWQQDGKERHHVIDPRTGEPAETDFLSVTTVAPHAAEAEAFAKGLLIAGSLEANRVIQSEPSIEFIAVDQDNKMWGSRHSRELLDV
jgi:thiamine biosynthesis lipoprotein